jgi:hypothetical protein
MRGVVRGEDEPAAVRFLCLLLRHYSRYFPVGWIGLPMSSRRFHNEDKKEPGYRTSKSWPVALPSPRGKTCWRARSIHSALLARKHRCSA